MKSYLILVLLLSILISSCESQSGRRASEKRARIANQKENEAKKFRPMDKNDSIVVNPEKFGASEIITNLQAYPTCDGGECYSVSYTIGAKLLGEDETRVFEVDVRAFSPEKGQAKSKPEIEKAISTYTFVKTCFTKDISITLVRNQVTKIVRKEIWVGENFIPSRTIWATDREKLRLLLNP